PPVTLRNPDGPSVALELPPLRSVVGLRLAVTDPTGSVTVADGILRVNNPPVAWVAGPVVAAAGESFVTQLGASDPDGDAVRFTLLAGPAGLTVGRQDGRLRWTAGDIGHYLVRVAIEDVDGLAGEPLTFAIQVTDGSSVGSPLPAAGTSGRGGGGSAGLAVLAMVALAAAALARRSRP